jgi:folate-dependent phosphoribosylglycinamide formyltransferase PurN
LRIVLLSCKGAPLSAEVLNHIRERDDGALGEIVGVVLSRPKPRNSRDLTNTARDVLSQGGFRHILHAISWRWNATRGRTGIALRKWLSRVLMLRYKRIEDFCVQSGIRPYTTDNINNPEGVEYVRGLNPDLIVIITFHHLLKPEVFTLSRLATLNLHCSLLPHYRGPDPINKALADGAPETGVTVHWLDEGADTGDIVLQKKVPVLNARCERELRPRLAQAGAEILLACIDHARHSALTRKPQPELRRAGNR